MNKTSSSQTYSKRDDYPKVTQADLDRACFRIGLKPAPRKQRVTILLDTGLVEYFKTKSGGRGYQTLINDVLRQSVLREDFLDDLRRVLREERRRETRPPRSRGSRGRSTQLSQPGAPASDERPD